MNFKPLLYPQTLFYPTTLLKAAPYVENFFVLSLLETEKRIKTLLPEIFPKVIFLDVSKYFDKNKIFKLLEDFKAFGDFLKTPESFKLYRLHQELFEETFSPLKESKDALTPIDRAFLLLALAEEIDHTLLEVSLALSQFSQKWAKFFDEKILFKDSYLSEEPFVFPTLEELGVEKLWELEKRKKAWETLFTHINFTEKYKERIDSLLLSERELLEDLKGEVKFVKEESLSEGLKVFEFETPVNKHLGFQENSGFPLINKILFVY